MVSVGSQTTRPDGSVKIATKLAQAAGVKLCCIGLVDCKKKSLAKVCIGIGASSTPVAIKTTHNILSQALVRSGSLTQSASRMDGDADSITWIKSPRILIGIGEQIGNLATMAAFVTDDAEETFSAEHQRSLEIGLAYAEEMLHDHLAPKSKIGHAKFQDLVLRSISFGLAIVDATGALNYMTESSKSWLKANDEVHIVNGRIAARTPINQARLQKAIAQAAGEIGKTSVLRLDGLEGPLQAITVMPISDAPHMALLILGKNTEGDSKIRGKLLDTLGLTMAERKLALKLVTGASLAAAAKESNITISTARSYLKTIFAKTGTHRQSELILLYHNLMPPVQSTTPKVKKTRAVPSPNFSTGGLELSRLSS